MADGLADQRQADVLAILVTVTHHHAAAGHHPQHRHQLRLTARLETHTPITSVQDLFDYAALLVDLDRIDSGVAPLVIVLLHFDSEGIDQGIDAIVEDTVKP